MDQPFSTARIDFTAEDLKKVAEAKVGGKVRLVLYGTVTEMASRQKDTSTEAGADSGHLTMTVSQMRTATNNEFAELFDADFDA